MARPWQGHGKAMARPMSILLPPFLRIFSFFWNENAFLLTILSIFRNKCFAMERSSEAEIKPKIFIFQQKIINLLYVYSNIISWHWKASQKGQFHFSCFWILSKSISISINTMDNNQFITVDNIYLSFLI